MSAKKTTYRTGLAAEVLCRVALRVKGHRLLASWYKLPLGEIDIVAMRGRTVAVVEMKARVSQEETNEAVRPPPRERLNCAANDFLARHPYFNQLDIRFDVMLVAPRPWPTHSVDAWRPD